MLGFRSFYRTHDTPQLLDVVAAELFVWLRSKRYDAAVLVPGPSVEIGDDVWGTLQTRTDEVGSQTMRAQIVENTRQGAWTSELTTHVSPTGNRGWVWLDVHNPRDRGWTATPRLARGLVQALPARDGAHLLSPEPTRVDEAGVDEVINALADPRRRGLAFVAGTSEAVPLPLWADKVADVLRDTVGLAQAWVLTPRATEHFNHRVGRAHGVEAHGIRTYAPGVLWIDPLDAERHRFLTPRGLAQGTPGVLRRILGHRAREQTIAAPMPEQVRDLERLLRRDADTALLDALIPTAPPRTEPAFVQPATTGPAAAEQTIIEPTPVETTTDERTTSRAAEPATSGPELPPELVPPGSKVDTSSFSTPRSVDPVPSGATTDGGPDLAAELIVLLRGVLGTSEPTEENLARLREAATAPHVVPASRDRIEARFDELRAALEEAEFERDLAREEVGGLQLEREMAEEEHAETRRQLRHVQVQLVGTERADQAWTEPEVDVRDIRPDNFADLLARAVDLTYVVFTGDHGTTEGLDDHGNARSWAGIAWDALLALDDYARASLTDGLARDVAGYLLHTPSATGSSPRAGMHRPSPRKSSRPRNCAAHESCRSRLRSTPPSGPSWAPTSSSPCLRQSVRGCTTSTPRREPGGSTSATSVLTYRSHR